MNTEGFKDRLKLAIEGYSVSSFAKKCDMPESLLRKYLTTSSLPGLDKLVAIADKAGVSIGWLAAGEGPMRLDGEKRSSSGIGEEANPELDEELFEAVIEVVEELLLSLDKRATPKQKAQIISALYHLSIEKEDHGIDRPTALRLVKMAAA